MAVGLIDKLTNFIMPLEESTETQETMSAGNAPSKSSHLRVHSNSPSDMKMAVVTPLKYEDVKGFADYLKAGISVIINFSYVDEQVQQCMTDFLNGVCYVIGGSSEKISAQIRVYVPNNIVINKELFAYSVPTYVKQRTEVN